MNKAQLAERALDSVLTALTAHRASSRAARTISAINTPGTDLADFDVSRLDEDDLQEIAKDPIGVGLTNLVKELGERLDAIGGFDAMKNALKTVSELDQAEQAHRISICDGAWDGIGQWLR